MQEAVQERAVQVSWRIKYGAEARKVTGIAHASWTFS
jgi:hypothetical protein